jgi:phosphatidylinositol-3-phosphatase
VSYLDFPLPPPWVRGLLVLVFLGFGVFIGSVTSSSAGTQDASAQAHLRLVLPAAAAAGAGGSGASAGAIPPTSTSSVPPPASSHVTPEATPEVASPKTASTKSPKTAPTKPSKTPTPSGASQGSSGASQGSSGAAAGKLPPIKHVFLIALADQPYAAVFGPASKASYLSHTLEHRGELLVRYYAVAHDELANGIALLSGQGPTAQTALNCPTFADIASPSVGAQEQVTGNGCVYPRSTETLMGQLAAKHLTWRAYVEGMGGTAGAGGGAGTAGAGTAGAGTAGASTAGGGASTAGESGAGGGSGTAGGSGACVHPTLGAADPTVGAAPPASTTPGAAAQGTPANQAAAGEEYTTFRNPFMYFHSVIDSPPACAADDTGIEQLGSDLKSVKRTPTLSYIVPSLCDDGSPTPCAPGKPAGMGPADAFLQKVVPEIMASKAYKNGGLLAITVDQAPATGIEADSSSCCGQPRFPSLPAPAPLPGGGKLPPSGGGQVGALLLSRFVKAGNVDQDPYNHFSLLRTIEDLFGLKHLGYAGASGIESFNAAVFEG